MTTEYRATQLVYNIKFKLSHAISIFIGPEFDHWPPMSLTYSLTPWRLIDLIDVILACEDANSKLVDVVTLMLLMRILLATVCFEIEVHARFWG